MGWWWNRGTPQSSQSVSEAPGSANVSQHGSDARSNATEMKPTQPESQDESHDSEVEKFLALLKEETEAEHAAERASPDTPAVSSSSIAPDSLYPTTMSCRQAFDQAFYCQSLGGQFSNYYRYGTVRSCGEHWSDFWFCMRTKSSSDQTRREMIQEHYRQKAAKYKIGPSSEDVWEVRKEPLEGAFSQDPEAIEEGIKANGQATDR